jgi:hypothetical protein
MHFVSAVAVVVETVLVLLRQALAVAVVAFHLV